MKYVIVKAINMFCDFPMPYPAGHLFIKDKDATFF